jgi:hypothetical protein
VTTPDPPSGIDSDVVRRGGAVSLYVLGVPVDLADRLA